MKEIEEFKQLIIEKKYYEAHEALEELWFPIRKSKTNYCLVLKGFINGAVSLELFKRDKIVQSKNVYKTYMKYTTQERLNNLNETQYKEEFKKLKVFMNKQFEVIYHNQYHLGTKHSFHSIRTSPNYLNWEEQPKVFKNYTSKKFISFDNTNKNHQLITLTAGLNAKKTYPGVEYYLRTNPSAGALYPIELYFQSRGVDGFEDGIYHYEANKDGATFLSTIESNNGIDSYILDDVKVEGFIFLFSSVYYRSSWKYKNRAFRYCLLDSGHMLGSLEASSYVSSKECRIIYAFKKDELNRLFNFEEKEFFLACAIVGAGHKDKIEKINFDLEYCDGTNSFEQNKMVEQGYINSLKINEKKSQNKQPKFNFNKDVYTNTINQRRSIREFMCDAISKVEFESIMDIVTQPIFNDCDEEVSIYCVINNVSNMEQGLYKDGEYLKTGNFRQQAGYLCLEQALGAQSGVTIFLTTTSQNYQQAYQKAGIIGHRFYLVCEYLGIGCSGIGAYYDDEVNEFIEKNEMVLYGITIGR